MAKSSKIYDTLNPVQRQFVLEKTVSTTMKIGKWLSLLSKVALYDELGDRAIKRSLIWIIVTFVAAVVSLFFIELLEEWSIIICMILVAIAILLIIRRRKMIHRDINNYLRLFFVPLLHVLEEKAGTEAKLSATLDFRNPRKAHKPEESRVAGRKLKLFKPVYIVSRVKLKDGVLLEFVVAEDIKDLSWTKRSASGKQKYKTKSKLVQYCTIKMTLPKEEYKWSGISNNDVVVAQQNGHNTAKYKVKIKKLGTNEFLNVKSFFDGVQLIYTQFEPLNPVAGAPPTQPPVRQGDEDVDDVLVAAPYIWYGTTFDQYDYDSFDHSDTGDFSTDDDSSTVFDS